MNFTTFDYRLPRDPGYNEAREKKEAFHTANHRLDRDPPLRGIPASTQEQNEPEDQMIDESSEQQQEQSEREDSQTKKRRKK